MILGRNIYCDKYACHKQNAWLFVNGQAVKVILGGQKLKICILYLVRDITLKSIVIYS